MNTILTKIKTGLRISHDKLDDDILDEIDVCIADLELAGIVHADVETDLLIFNAIKLWCKAAYSDDIVKSAEYRKRYEELKACLMMAEGYGWKEEDDGND